MAPPISGSKNLFYLGGGVTSGGSLFYANVFNPSPPLGATISGAPRPTFSGNVPLSAGISGVATTSIPSIITGIGKGNNTITGAFIRGTTQQEVGINGIIFPQSSGINTLQGVIRPIQSGSENLDSEIFPIPPVPLFATIIGNSSEDLGATLSAVQPIDLGATITGNSFHDLIASIDGAQNHILSATITGNSFHDLKAIISGFVAGESDILAEINTDGLFRLFCSISGFDEGEDAINASYFGIQPIDLPANIFGIPPVPLSGQINPTPVPIDLIAEISGSFTQQHLFAQITSTGGFEDLEAQIKPTQKGFNVLEASIDGASAGSLNAIINSGPQTSLPASITPSGPFNSEFLYANINGSAVSDITASISGFDSPTLGASYTANEGSVLNATIFPDVFFIDALIPVNTFSIGDLTASINDNTCKPRSDLEDLQAQITAIFKDDLSATILGFNNLVKTVDLLSIGFKKQHVLKDFLTLTIEPPTLATDYLPVTILNAPFGDLTASINGINMNVDLGATILPNVQGSFVSADPSTALWVNTKTGERKLIRFLFTLTGKTYYYSDVSNRTFPEEIKDTIKLIVESYKPIDQDDDISPTMLGTKSSVKRCVVSDLSCFNSWDEAVKFGIFCAVDIFEDLNAIIIPTGSSKELSAQLTVVDNDNQRLLPVKITPVGNQPDLFAQITSTGGFLDLDGVFIRPFVSAHTNSPETIEELNSFLAPFMLTFSGTDPQLLLQSVLGSGNIIYSDNPDLLASIRGIALDDFTASITGTP